MRRILVADDEEKLRKVIMKYLDFQGYEAVEAVDGQDAVEQCREQRFDLIILDVMMPRMDGVAACRRIRKLCDTPILMLTAKGEEYDRIVGFESGADDYVVKPFSPKELMLRIESILRRSAREGSVSRDIVAGRLTFSPAGRWVETDGKRTELTAKELELLSYLMARTGQVIPRRELCLALWQSDAYNVSRTLDTHIKCLRKALGVCSGYITTIYGVGYRFEVT